MIEQAISDYEQQTEFSVNQGIVKDTALSPITQFQLVTVLGVIVIVSIDQAHVQLTVSVKDVESVKVDRAFYTLPVIDIVKVPASVAEIEYHEMDLVLSFVVMKLLDQLDIFEVTVIEYQIFEIEQASAVNVN